MTDEQLWGVLGEAFSLAQEEWYEIADQQIKDTLDNTTIPLPKKPVSGEQDISA